MLFKSKAVILKTQDLKEADKLVWLFTEKLGKVSAVAKGARKNKSKFLPITLPFSFGEYMLFKGKSLFIINEGELIDSFQVFLNDLDHLTYASYLCELIDIATEEGESNHPLFQNLIVAFYFMKNNVSNIEMLIRSFEVKLLECTGYKLILDHCCICRKKIQTSNYISMQYFGGVCPDCERTNGIYISNGTYNTLRFLCNASMEKVCRITASLQIKEELYKILSSMIEMNYPRKPKSLQIFNYLKRSEQNE